MDQSHQMDVFFVFVLFFLKKKIYFSFHLSCVVLSRSGGACTVCLTSSWHGLSISAFPCPDSFFMLRSMGTKPMYPDSASFGLPPASQRACAFEAPKYLNDILLDILLDIRKPVFLSHPIALP